MSLATVGSLSLLHNESAVASVILVLVAGAGLGMAVAVVGNLVIPLRRRTVLARYYSRHPGIARSRPGYRRRH